MAFTPQKTSASGTPPPEHLPLITARMVPVWTPLSAKLSLIQQNVPEASHNRLLNTSTMIPGDSMTTLRLALKSGLVCFTGKRGMYESK